MWSTPQLHAARRRFAPALTPLLCEAHADSITLSNAIPPTIAMAKMEATYEEFLLKKTL
jgi:hypothetical protein